MSAGYVLILGAKSDMAKAIAHRYAAAGYNLFLAARNHYELKGDLADIEIRYRVEVRASEFDVTDVAKHKEFYRSLAPHPAGVICVAGYLPKQEEAEQNFEEAKKTIDTNFAGFVSILEIIAADFEKRKKGFIVGISSVAGDRGRKKNYIYGSAKAGFSVYLSGLRNRLFSSKVNVLTVKPGFVATKMTQGMDLPEEITGDPKDVADDIFRAQQKGKDVIYTRWYWKTIMWVIIHIPEIIFKRLSI